jgi:hypothetical protein
MKTILALLLTLAVLSPADSLVEKGRELRVRSIMTGQPHPVLQAEAEAQAAYQAKIHRQGHFWWDKIRYPRIRPQIPECSTFSEVVNESWPGQDQEAAADEMYRSWKKSAGHWSAVDGPCRYYGYAMVLSDNGVWYACGIFAN